MLQAPTVAAGDSKCPQRQQNADAAAVGARGVRPELTCLQDILQVFRHMASDDGHVNLAMSHTQAHAARLVHGQLDHHLCIVCPMFQVLSLLFA